MRPALLILLLAGCSGTPAYEQRAEADLTVGEVSSARYLFSAGEGLLHVRDAGDDSLTLRASCPEFGFFVSRVDPALVDLTVRVWNLPPDVELVATRGSVARLPAPDGLPHAHAWRVTFDAEGQALVETAPRARGPFTVLAFGDIQGGLPRFADVATRLDAEPDADFILMLGDLSNDSRDQEFDELEADFARLRVPLYSTPGNHDVYAGSTYQQRFGRSSYSCQTRGVRFTSVDSSAATVAVGLAPRLRGWLDDGRDQVHVVFTHMPPTEALGLRGGQWSSRREAHAFVAEASEAGVDLLLMGHIHSYDAFELGGIPAYVAGGGGALEEQLDGIGRHFLRLDLGESEPPRVSVVRVDP